MNDIEVDKEVLLSKMRENRDKHQGTYYKVDALYRDTLVDRLDEMRRLVENGDEFDLREVTRLPQPQDHTESYDTAIAMLEMSVSPTVQLSEYGFRQYVRDEWDWSERFAAVTRTYTS